MQSHHAVQEKGRFEILEDYHLRVGQVTVDTMPPDGHALIEQRLDETEAGAGTAVTLIDAARARQSGRPSQPKISPVRWDWMLVRRVCRAGMCSMQSSRRERRSW
jgi:hypothetical protein